MCVRWGAVHYRRIEARRLSLYCCRLLYLQGDTWCCVPGGATTVDAVEFVAVMTSEAGPIPRPWGIPSGVAIHPPFEVVSS